MFDTKSCDAGDAAAGPGTEPTPASDNPFLGMTTPLTSQTGADSSQGMSAAAPTVPPTTTAAEPPPLLGTLDSASSQGRAVKPSMRRTKDDFYSSDSDEADSESTPSTAPARRQFKVSCPSSTPSRCHNHCPGCLRTLCAAHRYSRATAHALALLFPTSAACGFLPTFCCVFPAPSLCS